MVQLHPLHHPNTALDSEKTKSQETFCFFKGYFQDITKTIFSGESVIKIEELLKHRFNADFYKSRFNDFLRCNKNYS